MSLEPLKGHLRETPDGRDGVTSLAVSTLGRMAALGHGEATDVLREYVAYGPLWDYALDLLAELSDPSALEGLAEVVCARFETGKAMDDNLYYNIFATRETLKPLWQEWSETYPGIARLVGEVQEIYHGYERPQSWPDLRSAYVVELLAAADVSNRRQIEKILLSRLKHADVSKYVDAFQTNNPFAWQIAFACLTAMKRAEPHYDLVFSTMARYLESATEEETKRGRRHACAVVLRQLPPSMVLPVARRWYGAAEWHLNGVAGDILEEHATPEDIPQARALLAAAGAAPVPYYADLYRACNALEILARMRDVGPLPDVERAFVEIGYSYGRKRAAQAMQANAPEWFAGTYAFECMWDCEDETREIGCASVALHLSGATERLEALAADELEGESVREVARARLTT
jgi:hypothetical protein